MKFVATKNGMTTNFFSPLSFVAVFGSGIRDPGWVKIRIWDKHHGSANTGWHMLTVYVTRRWRRMRRRWGRNWTTRRRGCATRRTISPLFRSGIRCRPSLLSCVFFFGSPDPNIIEVCGSEIRIRDGQNGTLPYSRKELRIRGAYSESGFFHPGSWNKCQKNASDLGNGSATLNWRIIYF